MNQFPPIKIESSWFYRLFSRGTTHVAANGQEVRLPRDNGGLAASISVPTIAAIAIRPQWFWTKLTFSLLDGTEHCIAGLSSRDAMRVRNAAEEESSSRAKGLEKSLRELDEELRRLLDGTHYVRHSDSRNIRDSLVSTVGACRGLVREYLSKEAREALRRIEPLAATEQFEAAREKANELFIQKTIPSVQSAAVLGGASGLTDEQAAAIATDEDVTLVLAGAGTGKTAVITSKVAHLVRNRGVDPREILVLAFNKRAAAEIHERLPVDLAYADVRTFHAFGLSVIGHAHKKPSVSKLVEDSGQLRNFIEERLKNLLISSPNESFEVMDFAAYNATTYESTFDFNILGEYYEYLNKSGLYTLNGQRVKSFEEVEVANFLTLHGIDFQYERPFPVDTSTKTYSQYKPDFYLPYYDIYIEHFALDEGGHPPEHWHRYAEGVSWKQQAHRTHGTRLIETYSWQRKKGVLRQELRKQLEAAGVTLTRVPVSNLIQRFRDWVMQKVSWLARLVASFLNHVKTGRMSQEQLRRRADGSRDPARSHSFLNIFELIQGQYEAALAGELDFHDQINQATNLLRDGICPKQYCYILVDEFQDISAGRMELLKALRREDTAYFLVGDDWQSIYRFAGSDISLVRNCSEHFGYVKERFLSQTFRFGDGILKLSSDFIRQNSVQTQRTMRPSKNATDDGITIVVNSKEPESQGSKVADQSNGLLLALKDIDLRSTISDDSLPSLLVLGRYQNSQVTLRQAKLSNEYFSTIHAAKGKEAEYVIVLDLVNERRGFPSQVEDDPLMELVLPPASDGHFPHAEERRLFYVAMTRAKRGVYLVADSGRPSSFVEELRSRHGNLRHLGGNLGYEGPQCPRCMTGTLLVSQSRKNLRCAYYPLCTHLAPLCPDCDEGYLVAVPDSPAATCTNAACNSRPNICPKCGLGVLTKKSGPYSLFWGCSEFSSEPPCTYTRNLDTDNAARHHP